MCDLESFKKDLIRIRKEMIELFKSKKLNQDNIKNIQDYFKIKTSDGLKVNFNLISIKEVEKIAKENKPKMHLGHTIEAIQMSKVKIKDNRHYYNLLICYSEREDCQIKRKEKDDFDFLELEKSDNCPPHIKAMLKALRN